MKIYNLVILILFSFSLKVLSMTPAEPEIIKIKKGNFEIVSKPQFISGKDSTSIFEINFFKNKLLWEFDRYIGRKASFISPDGNTLILFGDESFGSMIKNREETVVLEIRDKDKNYKSYTFKDLTGDTLENSILKHNIIELSGGWIEIGHVLSVKNVNWEKRVLKLNQIELSF